MATIYLNCPPTADDVAALQTGDLVYLSGEIVVTGGLPAHKRMIDYLDKGLPLPLKMDGVFIHLPHMVEERADRKSTRLNSSHCGTSRMPSSA